MDESDSLGWNNLRCGLSNHLVRLFGSLLALALVCVVPWAPARATSCAVQGLEFSPDSGVGTGDPLVRVAPNPTLFAFWSPGREPVFKVFCQADGEALSYVLEELPSSSDRTVAQIQVDTAACSRFVVGVLIGEYIARRAMYEVDAKFEQPADRPRPGVMSARRENRMLGHGPSGHLKFETNVRPAALRVEVTPGAHRIVVPLWSQYSSPDPLNPGRFWLGETTCRGSNFPKSKLDQPMSVRVSALNTDGSTDVGSWQEIRPQPGTRPGQHGVAYTVQDPPPPLNQAAFEDAALPGNGWRSWLWFLLVIPGALAVAGAARWVASRRG